MLIEINEMEERILKEVSIKIVDDKKYVDKDELINRIEELQYDIEHLNDEINDIKEDLEDNYRPISKEEMYGYGE